MKKSLPRTPFSTPFSSSRKLLEARILAILAGPQNRPPLLLLLLVLAFCFFSVNLVSCQPAQPEEKPDGSNVSSADGSVQIEEPELLGSDSLDRLALNDSRLNDAVTASSYWIKEENPDGTWSYTGGHVEVEVILDETKSLTWELEDGNAYYPTLLAARLTDPDRDAIVLELGVFGSNYVGAEYRVLEVIDGALTETLYLGFDDGYNRENSYMAGAKIIDLDYNLLQAIRIPSSVNKWHNPEWYTAAWNGVDWNLTPDGYFTDYFDLNVPGHRFTLALRGRVVQPGDPYYPGGPQNTGDRPDPVYDDLIQLYDNGLTSHAFTSESFTPDPDRPFEGFRWEYRSDAVEVRDINFDGADDFGILCDATHSETHCWFVWDGNGSMFRYFASLGRLEVDAEAQQLTETLWNDDAGKPYKNVYKWNEEGGLLLAESGS